MTLGKYFRLFVVVSGDLLTVLQRCVQQSVVYAVVPYVATFYNPQCLQYMRFLSNTALRASVCRQSMTSNTSHSIGFEVMLFEIVLNWITAGTATEQYIPINNRTYRYLDAVRKVLQHA